MQFRLTAARSPAATRAMAAGCSDLNMAPGMSWMLLLPSTWNGVILPVVNATAGTSIVPIPWEHLLGFAGLWLAIYGGGHTIKSVLGR